MQITSVTPLLVYGGRQTWVFVRIETDAGITGVGEASVEGKERAVAAAVEDLSRQILGRDPRRIDQNWQIMYRHGFWRGGIVLNSALSGIEQAMWDITGKDLGVPVYRLLGGATRDRIRLYTHCGGATTESQVERARELTSQGWDAIKIGCPGPENYASERRWLEAIDERLDALRGAIGPDALIMMDAHGRLTPGQAIRLTDVLAEYDLFFLEEPVPPENVAALQRVARAETGVPLATGERLFTKWGYRELLEGQCVDFIQPDVCHDGGILETFKIAGMAETHYVRVAPHNPNGPVATAASLQLAACLPGFVILEYAENQPWRDQVIREPLEIINGYVELPDQPGLGVELDEDGIAALPYEPRDYRGSFWPDGGVADI